MPPKKQRATTSFKAKKSLKVATKSTVATKTASTAGHVAATTAETKSNAKKRAASEPPEVEEPVLDKKAKLACQWELFKLLADSPPPEEEFSAEDKALFSKGMLKFKKLRLTLSDHVPRSMAAIFESIKYEDAIADDTSIATQVDRLIRELKKRVLSGKRINEELAVIEKVNINHWAGEYDDDPDGLTKEVRMRIDDAKHMVGRLTGSYLKSITRQLNPFSGGGSNADMADEIGSILLHLAKQGKNIKREYMTVKAYYTKCDGKSGNPSDPALDLNYGSDEAVGLLLDDNASPPAFLLRLQYAPKKRTPAAKTKSKATAKTPTRPLLAPPTDAQKVALSTEAAPSAQQSHTVGLGSSGKKRAVDSPEYDAASINKKAKVAVAGEDEDDSNTRKEVVSDEKSWSLLSGEDFDRLWKLKDTLSSHVPATMRHIFEGIKYEKAVPVGISLAELIDILIDELKSKVLSGKDIAVELEVINDVDDKWHDGEYDDEVDDDDDGLPKDVRKRLSDAESMLQYMAGGALKSIMRQLNPFVRGAGSNRGMAGMIVATLENLAKDGSNIKREYMIVKSFGMGCGNNSDPDLNFESDEYADDG